MWPLVLFGLGLYALKRYHDAKKGVPESVANPDYAPAPVASPADAQPSQDSGGGGGGGYSGGPNEPSTPFSWSAIKKALSTPHLSAAVTPSKLAAQEQTFASRAGATLITSAQAPTALPRTAVTSAAAAVAPAPMGVAPKPGAFTGVIKR